MNFFALHPARALFVVNGLGNSNASLLVVHFMFFRWFRERSFLSDGHVLLMAVDDAVSSSSSIVVVTSMHIGERTTHAHTHTEDGEQEEE